MKTAPLKGTRDYLPKEVRIRDYLQNTILNAYQDAGFSRITTPIIEDAVNLDKSDGGENLNLIFKILKRGKKLDRVLEMDSISENDLCDMGLRYDLTLPLSRYYANNRNSLMTPFKVIQMDRVYRAENPQKGRLREFMQCDIDIIGDSSMNAEVELILTTAKALKLIGIEQFTVKINDRRILADIFKYCGFPEESNERLAIIFDKMDKIGLEGVNAELKEAEFSSEAISSFIKLFSDETLTIEQVAKVCDNTYIQNLQYIMDTVNALSDGSFPIVFAPSLVRGQGYYTGTIFEVEALGYNGACAGGGRYDNLIGKFLKEDIPAVGFSIGFERIFGILMEKNEPIPNQKQKIALFYNQEDYINALKKAEELRNSYMVSLFFRPKKLGKFLNRIEEADFDGYMVYGEEDGIKIFQS